MLGTFSGAADPTPVENMLLKGHENAKEGVHVYVGKGYNVEDVDNALNNARKVNGYLIVNEEMYEKIKTRLYTSGYDFDYSYVFGLTGQTFAKGNRLVLIDPNHLRFT